MELRWVMGDGRWVGTWSGGADDAGDELQDKG